MAVYEPSACVSSRLADLWNTGLYTPISSRHVVRAKLLHYGSKELKGVGVGVGKGLQIYLYRRSTQLGACPIG